MARTSVEELKAAFKKEKDAKVNIRMLAVCHVRSGMSAQDVADMLFKCPNWVRKWVERFETRGLDGLRDLPRAGRPPRVSKKKMDTMVDHMTETGAFAPVGLQQYIREKTGELFCITYIRKIIRQHGITRKISTRIHRNRASNHVVGMWKYNTFRKISRLKRRGYKLFAMDAMHAINDMLARKVFWALCGERVHIPYTGSHKRVSIIGAISDVGQMFRTGDNARGDTVASFLRELRRKFGKVIVMMDGAQTHKSGPIDDVVAEGGIEIIYLPKGSPYLNAIEAYWNLLKQVLLAAKHYDTFEDMCHAISEYVRTTRHHLDIMKFLNRKAEGVLTNF